MDWRELYARRKIAALTEVLMLGKLNKFALPSAEWVSIVKGALIAGAGAALTYLTQTLSGADFGTYTPAIVAVLSIVINTLRKVITNPETPPTPPEVE